MAKNSNTVHSNPKTKTAKQWIKEGRLIKEGAKGEHLWTNGFHQVAAYYYGIEDTYEATKDEIRKFREPELKKRREQTKERRQLACEEKIRREKYKKAILFRQMKIKESQDKPIIPCNNLSRVVVFDTETTGLDPWKDEILQFSACDGAGNILINTYIRPYFTESWKDAYKINKISPEQVMHAPYIHELIPVIKGIFENAEVLVAYNTSFDLQFLESEGIPINLAEKELFDVMLHFAPIYGEWNDYYEDYKWQKLSTCAAYYGYKFSAHDSMEDVKATLFCYNKIIDYYKARDKLERRDKKTFMSNLENKEEYKITHVCPTCTRQVSLKVSKDDFIKITNRSRELIQELLPHLDMFKREFLISHYCPKCQMRIFNKKYNITNDWEFN